MLRTQASQGNNKPTETQSTPPKFPPSSFFGGWGAVFRDVWAFPKGRKAVTNCDGFLNLCVNQRSGFLCFHLVFRPLLFPTAFFSLGHSPRSLKKTSIPAPSNLVVFGLLGASGCFPICPLRKARPPNPFGASKRCGDGLLHHRFPAYGCRQGE